MKLSAEETQVLQESLGGLIGGAVLGAFSGALAGLAGATLMHAEIPQLSFALLAQAAVGNGALFGAFSGALLLPNLLRGPLRGIAPQRWIPSVLIATSLASFAGLIVGTIMSDRAVEFDFARVPAGIGIIAAIVFGSAALIVTAIVIRARDDARRRKERTPLKPPL
jgi:hypothetical protein